MTSFELFRLLKLKKYLYPIYLYFFLLKCIMCDKTHHFMENDQIFCIKLWYNNWYHYYIMQEKL